MRTLRLPREALTHLQRSRRPITTAWRADCHGRIFRRNCRRRQHANGGEDATACSGTSRSQCTRTSSGMATRRSWQRRSMRRCPSAGRARGSRRLAELTTGRKAASPAGSTAAPSRNRASRNCSIGLQEPERSQLRGRRPGGLQLTVTMLSPFAGDQRARWDSVPFRDEPGQPRRNQPRGAAMSREKLRWSNKFRFPSTAQVGNAGGDPTAQAEPAGAGCVRGP